MSTIEALAKSIVTPAGVEIAERVALMIGQGLPIGAALAVAAEFGMEHVREATQCPACIGTGRGDVIDVHAKCETCGGSGMSNQAKHGEPR